MDSKAPFFDGTYWDYCLHVAPDCFHVFPDGMVDTVSSGKTATAPLIDSGLF